MQRMPRGQKHQCPEGRSLMHAAEDASPVSAEAVVPICDCHLPALGICGGHLLLPSVPVTAGHRQALHLPVLMCLAVRNLPVLCCDRQVRHLRPCALQKPTCAPCAMLSL